MELWGSPGGCNGGPGGYTKLYIKVTGHDLLYCIVGGAGYSIQGNITIGGYNGGGAITTCLNRGHAGSGGGMTHISYTRNVANGSWNPSGTIGCAGGGGGGSYIGVHGGAGGGINESPGRPDPRYVGRHYPNGASQTSGYRQGIGENCANSAAAGGGWYGGYSTGQTAQTAGGRCHGSAGGGSGYICDAGKQTSYTGLNICANGNSSGIPSRPNHDINGYIRVLLIERVKN